MFDSEDPSTLPPGLDQMEPGPALAAILCAVADDNLSGHDRVVMLRAHQRMASYFTARLYHDMAAVSDSIHEIDDDPQLATEAAAAEIRAALRLTRRAAEIELSFALDLRRRLPRVWELLAAGDIDVRRARTITDGTTHLSVARARQVVDEIHEHAPRLTTGELAARIRRLCVEIDPDHAADRYRTSVSFRRVVSEPTPDGTSHLMGFDLPPQRVAAIMRRINQLARSLRGSGEWRTMDQLRSDVFLDLLEGPNENGKGGVVDIHVDLDTLARLADHPGELAGYGPVIADIARQVADHQAKGEWRFQATDPDTGRVIHNGITRRRPTADQQREVEAHHPICIFPGCRMPATDCDLDHRTPYGEGGPTLTPNLAPLCRHDHRIRHDAGWVHQPLPNGDYRWITKLGHTYTTSGAPP